jgi:imidazolonepropionase
VATTFLGAHALPPEFEGEGDAYIQLIVEQMLPDLAAANLVDAVDVFCENIGFSRDQCERVFQCAQQLGLPVKGHVEQLSNLSGARLVAEYGGLSVDHLEYLADDDIPFIQQHNVVPVLLPGAFYFLNETQKPPVQGFRDAGVGMAIATDLNPGSSPICSLLLIMNMACVQFALTAEEALAGVTRHAARALGLGQSKGMIRAGMDADLVLWNIDDPSELSYAVNMSVPEQVWVAGQYV